MVVGSKDETLRSTDRSREPWAEGRVAGYLSLKISYIGALEGAYESTISYRWASEKKRSSDVNRQAVSIYSLCSLCWAQRVRSQSVQGSPCLCFGQAVSSVLFRQAVCALFDSGKRCVYYSIWASGVCLIQASGVCIVRSNRASGVFSIQASGVRSVQFWQAVKQDRKAAVLNVYIFI